MSANLGFEPSFKADFNVCNSNARDILSTLGFSPYFEESANIPIGEFKAAIHRYLKGMIGNVSPAVGPSGEDSNFIYCGRRENYIPEKCMEMLIIVNSAIEAGSREVYFV